MRTKKGESPFAGKSGGLGFEVGTMITIEAVASFLVKEERKPGMGLLDLLDIGSGDVFVLGAEVEHDGTAGLFGKIAGDLATVIADGGGRTETSGSEPGKAAAPTEADNSDLSRFVTFGFGGVQQSGRDIEERFFEADLGSDLHATSRVGGIVVELNARLDAIEKTRGDSGEPLGGVVVGDGADVAIHAVNLLKNDDGGRGGS